MLKEFRHREFASEVEQIEWKNEIQETAR